MLLMFFTGYVVEVCFFDVVFLCIRIILKHTVLGCSRVVIVVVIVIILLVLGPPVFSVHAFVFNCFEKS